MSNESNEKVSARRHSMITPPMEPLLKNKLRTQTLLFKQVMSLVEESDKAIEANNEVMKVNEVEQKVVKMLMPFHKKMIQIQDRMKEQNTRIRDNENNIRGILADLKKNHTYWNNFEHYKKSLEKAHEEIGKF